MHLRIGFASLQRLGFRHARRDRILVPFNIACGKCVFCQQELDGNCHESTPRATAVGGIFGYSLSTMRRPVDRTAECYGHIPNFISERGWGSEWKYDREKVVQRAIVGTVMNSIAMAYFRKSRR
jgi:hypothetical protein